jgi:hypothetical protein
MSREGAAMKYYLISSQQHQVDCFCENQVPKVPNIPNSSPKFLMQRQPKFAIKASFLLSLLDVVFERMQSVSKHLHKTDPIEKVHMISSVTVQVF